MIYTHCTSKNKVIRLIEIDCFNNPAFCPFWMKSRDGFSCVIPHGFVYNKFNDTVSTIMSPFIAACIRHIFFITQNGIEKPRSCDLRGFLLCHMSTSVIFAYWYYSICLSAFQVCPTSTTCKLWACSIQYHEYSQLSFRLGGSFAILRQFSTSLVCRLCFSMLRLGVQSLE